MSTMIQDLLARLNSAPKREWVAINPDDVRTEMTQRRADITNRQDRDKAGYEDRKPLRTANVADINRWEKEGINLPSNHQKELEGFDCRWSSLVSEVEGLGGLYEEYGRGYAAFEISVEEAKHAAEKDLSALEQRRVELEAVVKAQIEETHSKIVERLRGNGGRDAISRQFDGWERAVLRAFT